eukprot:GHVR01005815.1.p1 GENE.GHVR01005815.1~~GHVR01005815.1.p1  ORF type:complete len:159 (-),score=32.30 GHVR01005815.1:253-729(-)
MPLEEIENTHDKSEGSHNRETSEITHQPPPHYDVNTLRMFPFADSVSEHVESFIEHSFFSFIDRFLGGPAGLGGRPGRNLVGDLTKEFQADFPRHSLSGESTRGDSASDGTASDFPTVPPTLISHLFPFELFSFAPPQGAGRAKRRPNSDFGDKIHEV